MEATSGNGKYINEKSNDGDGMARAISQNRHQTHQAARTVCYSKELSDFLTLPLASGGGSGILALSLC